MLMAQSSNPFMEDGNIVFKLFMEELNVELKFLVTGNFRLILSVSSDHYCSL